MAREHYAKSRCGCMSGFHPIPGTRDVSASESVKKHALVRPCYGDYAVTITSRSSQSMAEAESYVSPGGVLSACPSVTASSSRHAHR